MKENKSKLITIGKLGASYGVRGWLRMNSFTEVPTDVFNYEVYFIQTKSGTVEAKLEDWKTHSNHLVCKFNVINSMEEAKLFNNCFVSVRSEDLPVLAEDEVYWKDLFGCKVVTTDGYTLGTVKSILETGSNDVLVLSVPLDDKYGKKERLVPFIPDQYLKTIDVANKLIVADWDPEF